MNYNKAHNLVLTAMFASLTAIFSQICIPIGPIPINFALVSVLISGSLLGSKYGAISQVIYVLLGCVGLPVFSGFTGGIGILLGPTGGYILGYVLAAFISGFLIRRCESKELIKFMYLLLSVACCYFVGTLWFIMITNNNLYNVVLLCVIPFIPADMIKIILVVSVLRIFKAHINIKRV